MAFRRDDKDKERPPGPPVKSSPVLPGALEKIKKTAVAPVGQRLVSLDAFRGFTMLLMASEGLSIGRFLQNNPDFLARYDGTWKAKPWTWGWQTLASQLNHVAWTGCVAWDLIQPSFMFMVGAAMPFSYANRTARGDSWGKQFAHAVVRSLVLILLGIFLRSTHSPMTNFTFEDVLTQIGLGYLVLFLLLRAPFAAQFVAALFILAAYWFYFFHFPLPPPEGNLVTRYIQEVRQLPSAEWTQFGNSGIAAHWNKHTNAAADFDRTFLNLFPRPEQPWEGKKFWINGGGYQTLNFIPSIVTMLLGLMAGELLRSPRSQGRKVQILLLAGAGCFAASMAIDTTIWPDSVRNLTHLNYSLCPVVKRIWSPSWAIFSGGWVLWFLALFYWVVDVCGFRRLAFPLAIVGMNSIAVYCMSHLIDNWLAGMLKIHLATVDALTEPGLANFISKVPVLKNLEFTSLVDFLYKHGSLSAIWRECAVLFLIWLISLWMYRRRLFIRV